MSTLVWRIFWSIERTDEMKWRVVDEFEVDLRRLVVLTICSHDLYISFTGLRHRIDIEKTLTSNLLVHAAKTSVHVYNKATEGM